MLRLFALIPRRGVLRLPPLLLQAAHLRFPTVTHAYDPKSPVSTRRVPGESSNVLLQP